jgi:4-diphosphocytidyl-2-C-methyl-D-erythritol kinase
MVIEAPCKINLHLAVGAKREDGFHGIESIFLALNLCDTLEFELKTPSSPLVEIEMDTSELPEELAAPLEALASEKNIIYKAVKLFWEKRGAPDDSQRPLKITVKKRIPSGAGLGGGSSDAAATLRAINTMMGQPLSAATLRDAAAELGSDMPFFLDTESGAAFVEGRGEKISAIPAPNLFFVLINPLFESGTARAFKLLDEFRANKLNLHEEKPRTAGKNDENHANSEFFSCGSCGSWLNFSGFRNDFLPAFFSLGTDAEKAAYRAMLADLKSAGADFASLSGSGSTCFGVFSRQSKAEEAAQALEKKCLWIASATPHLC